MRKDPAQHIIQFFGAEHLPPHLQEVVEPFHNLAVNLECTLGSGPELTAGLRKLLEAKDCFVRQAVLDAQERSA